jgi:hypothetical protein
MVDLESEPKVNIKTGIVEMSMRISKASFNKSEEMAMKWAAIDSDVDPDLYDERMSIELYKDFVDRIENNTPIPEPFHEVICENDWCGGMPYLSIAHYKAGTGLMNVPGAVESVFIDGTRLKSKGTLNDSEMGRRVFNALREDLYMKEKSTDHSPVRISIGFLDLEHKHLSKAGGQEFTFTRSDVGQMCPLCAQGIGGKIYMKGQLVHLAMTRVPVNPRTEMSVEKSMDEITTKRDDAKSIIGDLAEELEEKSIAGDVLVVRADENGSAPVATPSEITRECYDPNLGSWNNECIAQIMDKYMPEIRKELGVPVKSNADKSLMDAVVAYMSKSFGIEVPVVEDKMEVKSETVEKMVAGGENVPVKPFKHTQDGVTITGGVDDNKIASPVPAKADVEEEDEKKEHMKEMSEVQKAFASLEQAIASKNVDAVNAAFAGLGTSVEKSFAPEQKPVDANDLAAIVKSAVEAAVNPLRIQVATLEAQVSQGDTVSTGNVVKSKALNLLNPTGMKVEDVVKRAVAPAAPVRQLSQIERIARASTGAKVD